MPCSKQREPGSATGDDKLTAVPRPAGGLLPTRLPAEPVRQGTRLDDPHTGARLGVPTHVPGDSVQDARQVGQVNMFFMT